MPLRCLPPALLLGVFLVQITLVRTTALTPWKGGGFGMFSTLDHGAFRRISVIVEAADRSESVDVATSLEEAEARAVACPSDRLLRELAAGVVARERRYGRPVASLTLTVWSVEFTQALTASERRLRTYKYEADRR
jgi:hypothetical protein